MYSAHQCTLFEKEMSNYEESEYQNLKFMILAGARATSTFRNPRYKYYYLACPCLLGCGCKSRARAWPLPLDKCYNYELLDRACEEDLLGNIGYDVFWFCVNCGLPSSCGGEA